ncbi:hypothetical protein AB0J72_36525 [Dactylosporangium sp. NPDC049742]|uniref:hypothetical protein n=1 Tax=Dactylosporangium sp. NPDC049742 TaxID=3154737 RepID=UPI00344756C2
MSHVATTQHGRHELHTHPSRWFALAIIAVAQLMVVLDATVVNVALPQVGGSLGTALLNTVAITAATSYFTDHAPAGNPQGTQLEAMVHGYVTAFWWGSALLVAAAVIVAVFIKAGKDDIPAEGAVHMG